MEVGEGERIAYLFFLVALLAEVFPAAGHFDAAHGVFFGREVFFCLRFYRLSLR